MSESIPSYFYPPTQVTKEFSLRERMYETFLVLYAIRKIESIQSKYLAVRNEINSKV